MYKFLTTIVILFSLFFGVSQVEAFKADTFTPLIHIIEQTGNPLDVPKIVYEESTRSGVFNTWVLTSAAVKNASVSAYFQKISKGDPRQEIGLFLKNYGGVELQSLQPKEREVILDEAMNSFFSVFGSYPKTVAANNFDAHSLQYLQSKYSVLGVISLPRNAEETPSVNGAYSVAPFFPSSKDHYLPAKSYNERINLAFSETVDLENFNVAKDLGYYGQKYLNEFTLLNLKTDNSSKTLNRKTYRAFLKGLANEEGKYNLHFVTYSTFSDRFKARYPESSPASLYKKVNADNTTTYLYQSPWYKLVFTDSEKSVELVSLNVYNHNSYEPSVATPSLMNDVYHKVENVLQGKTDLSIAKKGGTLLSNYLKNFDFWSIKFQNNSEKITLNPDSLIFEGLSAPSINNSLIKVANTDNSVTWTPQDFSPFQNTSKLNILFWFVLIVVLLYLLFKKKDNPTILGLFLVAVAGITTFRSGLLYSFGMGFWGPNGHDAIFHLSIINKFLLEPFNLSHPQISSEVLSNYHFVFAYLSATVIKLTHTPLIFYYFVVFPIIAGIFILKLSLQLFKQMKLNEFQKGIALVFMFLGSSFGYILRFFQSGSVFGGESAFWANQSVSMFLNPPFVLSLVFLLAFLNIYAKENKVIKDYIWLVLFGSLLAQTKVYAFILLCLGLALRVDLVLVALVGVGGLLLSIPFTKVGASPFIFQPLWFLKSMFESSDRAYWQKAAEAWQVYEATGAFAKLFVLNSFALLVFIIGNLGVRVFGLYQVIKEKVQGGLDGLLKSIIFCSLVLPLLFVQRVNPWNSIQFLYYGLFFLSFYTASFFSKKSLLTFILILMGTFGSVGTLADYATTNSTARVTYVELSALEQLSRQPWGIVLSPIHPNWSFLAAPQPLYDYVSSSYISALSGQKEFLSDTINLDITGIDYKTKANSVNRFYNTLDTVWAKEFLSKNNITYIVETPIQKMTFDPANIPLTKIFSSGEVSIYKLNY